MPEPVCDPPQALSDDQQDPSRSLLRSEDWWSVWLGSILIIAVILEIIPSIPKLGTWSINPLSALAGPALCGELLLVVGMAALTAVGMKVMGRSVTSYLKGFAVVVAIALLAKLIGRQESLKAYGLGYALWALVFGLLISKSWAHQDGYWPAYVRSCSSRSASCFSVPKFSHRKSSNWEHPAYSSHGSSRPGALLESSGTKSGVARVPWLPRSGTMFGRVYDSCLACLRGDALLIRRLQLHPYGHCARSGPGYS